VPIVTVMTPNPWLTQTERLASLQVVHRWHFMIPIKSPLCMAFVVANWHFSIQNISYLISAQAALD